MVRAYAPLRSVAYPPEMALSNGVEVASRARIEPSDLSDLDEVFSGRERRELRDWHLALFYEWEEDPHIIRANSDVDARLTDAHVALQVVAPIGNHLFVTIEEGESFPLNQGGATAERRLRRTTHSQLFYGTVWSRMSSFRGVKAEEIRTVANGVLDIFATRNARIINPLRMFEHGLNSTNPYIRVFLWASALDGIMMAVKERVFVQRLMALLGPTTLVFPPSDGVFFERPTTVADVAADIFELRSEIAHGAAIGRKFWEQREDLRALFPFLAYGQETPRYFQLLEEAVLSLLRQVVHKIVRENLINTFADANAWRAMLKSL